MYVVKQLTVEEAKEFNAQYKFDWRKLPTLPANTNSIIKFFVKGLENGDGI